MTFARLWRCATVRAGAPCIRTTAIEAEEVARRFVAGESVLQLATEYGISAASVEEALRLALYCRGTSLESKLAWSRIARVIPETRRRR